MNYFALFLFVLSITSDAPAVNQDESRWQKFNVPDRTITWRAWRQSPKGEYRFRTGDRYLGRGVWEHYLCFEQHRSSSKAIKLSMIRLGSDDVREEALICPGSRYAIFKVTNGTMTARKGVWIWAAQEERTKRGCRPPVQPAVVKICAFQFEPPCFHLDRFS
jgi:hypothetical protein